jgi:hypothetical protein
MQKEAQRIDPFDKAPATGILGRMCDVLATKGFNPIPITIEDVTIATAGKPGIAIAPLSCIPQRALARLIQNPEKKPSILYKL